MQRLFNFQEYLTRNPISHELLIERLFESRFEGHEGSRRVAALERLSTIINATFKLSNQMGFAQMSMRDLNKECGFSIGTLYNSFESKNDLAEMITRALHHINTERLPKIINPALTREQQLETLLRSYIYLAHVLHKWFLFVFHEYKNLPESTQRSAIVNEMNYQAHLDRIFGCDRYPSSHLLPMIQDWFLKQWKHRGEDVDHYADRIVRIGLLILADVDAGNAGEYARGL